MTSIDTQCGSCARKNIFFPFEICVFQLLPDWLKRLVQCKGLYMNELSISQNYSDARHAETTCFRILQKVEFVQTGGPRTPNQTARGGGGFEGNKLYPEGIRSCAWLLTNTREIVLRVRCQNSNCHHSILFCTRMRHNPLIKMPKHKIAVKAAVVPEKQWNRTLPSSIEKMECCQNQMLRKWSSWQRKVSLEMLGQISRFFSSATYQPHVGPPDERRVNNSEKKLCHFHHLFNCQIIRLFEMWKSRCCHFFISKRISQCGFSQNEGRAGTKRKDWRTEVCARSTFVKNTKSRPRVQRDEREADVPTVFKIWSLMFSHETH